jgi:hypothetical protein
MLVQPVHSSLGGRLDFFIARESIDILPSYTVAMSEVTNVCCDLQVAFAM